MENKNHQHQENENGFVKGNCVLHYFSEFIKNAPNDGKLIFRGLSNVDYGIVSSAGLRLGKNQDKMNNFIRYHINLISNARKFGYGNHKPTSELSDLEILADLQHYGGATCLIDFSTNFLIGLWFACAKDSKKIGHNYNEYDNNCINCDKNDNCTKKTATDSNGILYWIDLSDEKNSELINICNNNISQEPIQQILKSLDFNPDVRRKEKAEPCYWLWEPSRINNRIISQDSVFLFSLRAFPLPCQKTDDNISVNSMEINFLHKDLIREELESYFGISSETIFQDFNGFASESNNKSAPINQNILPTNIDCLKVAKLNIKRHEFSLATSIIDNIIKIKDNIEECKTCNIIKIKDNTEECKTCNIIKIKDNTEECKTCNSINKKKCEEYSRCELYYYRGLSNMQRDPSYLNEAICNFKDAIHYCNKEIVKDLDLRYQSYMNLIDCYYQQNNYHCALQNAELLWNSYKNEDSNVGFDSIFSILELCIILFDGEKFMDYIKVFDDQSLKHKYENTNGEILRILFQNLGNIIFKKGKNRDSKIILNKGIKHLKEIIAEIINNNNNNNSLSILVGYYYWDFTDLITHFNNVFEKLQYISNVKDLKGNQSLKIIYENFEEILLIIEKAHEAQSKLVNKIFEDSRASNLNEITVVSVQKVSVQK